MKTEKAHAAKKRTANGMEMGSTSATFASRGSTTSIARRTAECTRSSVGGSRIDRTGRRGASIALVRAATRPPFHDGSRGIVDALGELGRGDDDMRVRKDVRHAHDAHREAQRREHLAPLAMVAIVERLVEAHHRTIEELG